MIEETINKYAVYYGSITFICTDVQSCLDSLSGANTTETIVSITAQASEFSAPITSTLTREHLRTLRVEWMYQSTGSLWLNDEVIIAIIG